MLIKKGDFIEIEFTGKISDSNEIFDTNIESDAKKAGIKTTNVKAHIISVGHKMLPIGFDEDLEGKEEGKEYSVEINPEKAFGKRNPKMIQMIPTKLFHAQKIEPVKGMQLTLDGQLVRILSSDRGRTLVDFNNPLAGKKITYKYKIKKKITNKKEQIESLQDFLFRQKFEFEEKERKIIFKAPKEAEQFIKIFSPKFEEILKLKVEFEELDAKHK